MKQRFGVAQALLGKPQIIIVDEPTAGLDPEERNRFLNLLSEIGENVVVILSTHIVEDVSELCTNMAIIEEGEVRYTGRPQAAIETIRSKTWRTVIDRSQLPAYEENYQIISRRLAGGQTLLHVLSEDRPDSSFDAVQPDLRDVYFSILSRPEEEL
jgi:ABC-type multidrug transport system ATPase subunit